jgi:hypothetical protein
LNLLGGFKVDEPGMGEIGDVASELTTPSPLLKKRKTTAGLKKISKEPSSSILKLKKM